MHILEYEAEFKRIPPLWSVTLKSEMQAGRGKMPQFSVT